MPKPVVLDSSALLAIFNFEPGGDRVSDLTKGALVSTVNLTEVHAKLLAKGISSESAWSVIFRTGIEAIPFDLEQSRLASEMTLTTRAYGLSLGDRACLALGTIREAVVYTGDRIWSNLVMNVEVRVFR